MEVGPAVGVEVSMLSVRLRKATLACVDQWRRLRPSRSRRQTTRVSPGRSCSSGASRAGRRSSLPEDSSTKTRAQPADRRASTWSASSCSREDTRAYRTRAGCDHLAPHYSCLYLLLGRCSGRGLWKSTAPASTTRRGISERLVCDRLQRRTVPWTVRHPACRHPAVDVNDRSPVPPTGSDRRGLIGRCGHPPPRLLNRHPQHRLGPHLAPRGGPRLACEEGRADVDAFLQSEELPDSSPDAARHQEVSDELSRRASSPQSRSSTPS